MSIFGTPNSRPVGGAEQAQRAAARASGAGRVRDGRGKADTAPRDEVEITNIDGPDTSDGARRPGGNAQEDTAEDRRKNPAYAKKTGAAKPKGPTLDIQG